MRRSLRSLKRNEAEKGPGPEKDIGGFDDAVEPKAKEVVEGKKLKEKHSVDVEESPIISSSMIQTNQQRHIVKMPEKSLASELHLERKFLEAREHEEELKLKFHYTEQVVSHMEENSEAALAKFFEADNAAEVLLGTSKESLSRLQITQFSLNVSLQRENDLKRKLENCVNQLLLKDEIIQKLQGQMTKSETGINCKHEEDNIAIHALCEKVTLLEKQVRYLEFQLQHAKAASEASQEQQTLLYTAIWDMETLIEDLKSKVSKYESKIESTEEQCLLLSETNFELNNERSFVKERLEFVEALLGEANSEKLAISTDINIRSKLIMEMIAQLATERERYQKLLTILCEEKNALAHKLHSRSTSSAITPQVINGKIGDDGLVSNAHSFKYFPENDDRAVA